MRRFIAAFNLECGHLLPLLIWTFEPVTSLTAMHKTLFELGELLPNASMIVRISN